MNLDFAAGEVVTPPIPPTPIPDTGGGGATGGGRPYQKWVHERGKEGWEEKTKKRIKEEDEFLKVFLKVATNIINNQ